MSDIRETPESYLDFIRSPESALSFLEVSIEDLKDLSVKDMCEIAAEIVKENPHPEGEEAAKRRARPYLGFWLSDPALILREEDEPPDEQKKEFSAEIKALIRAVYKAGGANTDIGYSQAIFKTIEIFQLFILAHQGELQGDLFRDRFNGFKGELGIVRALMEDYRVYLPSEEVDVEEGIDLIAIDKRVGRNAFLINARGRHNLAEPHYLVTNVRPRRPSPALLEQLDPELRSLMLEIRRHGIAYRTDIFISTNPDHLPDLDLSSQDPKQALRQFARPLDSIRHGIIRELGDYLRK